MRHAHYSVAVLVFGVPSIAQAEVADKMASPQFVWYVALVVATLAFFACRRWPRASFALVPPLCVVAWYVAYGDPETMAAYRLEIGTANFWIYRFYLLVSGALMPVAALVGGLLGWRRIKGDAT